MVQQPLIKLDLGKIRFLEIRNTTVLTKYQLQSISTHKSNSYSYKHLDSKRKQEHVRLEADRIQNRFTSRSSLQKQQRKNGMDTHKQEIIISLILGCKQGDKYVLTRSQKASLQFWSLFSSSIFCIFRLIHKL